MGSLSNLYISQSYQSLIHLGTNNTASATLIGLEDGLGNPIGVSVNTAGNLYLSGTFSASLQEGYLYVGNASGRTIAFPTSSLVTNINTGSLVTTSSFNSYTASTNIRLSNIELTTASVLISISNLNASSASQQISINALNVFTASQSTASIVSSITNLNAFTQSANIRLNNLETTSASVNTSITNINAYTQSNDLKWQDLGNKSGSWITESETGSFARWDVSNPWSANQNFTNITAFSASFTYVQTVFETASVIYSSGSNQFGDELTDTQTLSGSVKVQGSLTVNGVPVQTSSVDISALNQATQSLQAFTASQETKNTTLESVTSSLQAFTSSANSRLNNLEGATSSYAISSSVAAVDAAQQSQIDSLIAATSSYANSASFAASQLVQDNRLNNIEAKTGSYATTGSNTFTGYNQFQSGILVNTALNVAITSGRSFNVNNDGFEWDGNYQDKPATFKSYVNITKDLNVTGSLTASLQEGYVWVGNASGKTTTVSTASFIDTFVSGNLVTTASFNAYTQSNDQRVGSLEAATASYAISASVAAVDAAQQAQINSLINATGSYVTETESGSFLITASFASQTLTFTKGDGTTFGVVIPDISGSTIDTGSFVTTSSFNAYTGSNDQRVTSLESNSASVNISIANINVFTQSADQRLDSIEGQSGSWVTSAITGSSIITASVIDDDITFTKGDGSTFTIQVATGSFVLTSSFNAYTQSTDNRLNNLESTTASLNTAVTNINSFTQSANGRLNSLEAATSSYVTETESGSFLITGSVAGNVLTFTKGDNTTFNLTVATGSAVSTDTGSLLLTASASPTANTITFTKGNNTTFDVTLNITASASASIDTGSFATTGSNTFFGSNTFNNSPSDVFRVNWGSASSASLYTENSGGPNQTLNLNSASLYINRGGLFFDSGSFTSQIGDMQFNAYPSASFTIRTQYGGDAVLRSNSDYTNPNLHYAYFRATPNGGAEIIGFGNNVVISGSGTTIQGVDFIPFSASLSSRINSINTGSFATTGSNTFTGQQVINANSAITISGSDGFGYGIRLQGAQGILLEGSGGPRIQFPNSSWFNGNQNEDLIFTSDTDNPLTRGLDFFLYGSGSQRIRFRNNSGPGATIVFTNQSGSISFTAGSSISMTGSSLQLQGLTYPNVDGTNGQVLTTNGAGILSFTTVGGGGSINTGSFLTTGSNSTTQTGNGLYRFNAPTGGSGVAIALFNTGSDANGTMQFGITDPGNPFIQLKGQTWFQFGTNNELQFASFTSSFDNGIIVGPYYTASAKVRLMPRSSSLQFSHDIGSGEQPILQLGQTHSTPTQSIFFTPLRVNSTFTASLQNGYAWVGDASGVSVAVATSSFTGGGGTTYTNPTLNPYSGSLILAANLTSTASLAPYITASNNGQVNLMFLNRNLTGGVYISGSSNIFPNPNTPTAGRLNYLGGSSNILLTSFTSNNSQTFPSMTASAATIGGVYPAMNGNILMGQAGWTINPSNNPGIHNYNNNILNGNTTFNTVGNVQTAGVAASGRIDFTGNTTAGNITINSPSRSLAEIAAGATGSMRLSIQNNNIQGTFTYNGPISGSATANIHNIAQNNVAGTLTLNIQSGSKSYTVSSNNINGTLTYNDNVAFTPTLGSGPSIINNLINGNVTANTRNSASLNLSNNNINTWTISSDLDASAVTLSNVRTAGLQANALFGQTGNNILFSGSSTGTTTKAIFNNLMAGTNISASVGGGEQGLLATSVLGNGLHVFGTSLYNGSNQTVGGERQGSLFTGRWNSLDGTRGFTAETVFAVGTGTSGSAGIVRKTGFLIDSGSNTFVEGTLNVSGSSTLSGSLYIQSGSTLPVSTGSAILTWNAATGQVNQASFSTIVSASVSSAEFWSTTTQSGSAGVSGSIQFNNSGSFYNISLVNGTQLTVGNAGVYNIQFSAQVETSAGADTVYIWFKKNGTNIGDSASKAVLANNTAQVITVNILDQAVANDYYEIAYQNINGHATVLAEAASGNIPAIPSVIATIIQVR